jgi:hypothetical protein
MIAIDKNVPLPQRTWGGPGGRPPKYPWAEMEVGDSFFVLNATTDNLSAAGTMAAKRSGRKFTTRKENGGVRVWRIA